MSNELTFRDLYPILSVGPSIRGITMRVCVETRLKKGECKSNIEGNHATCNSFHEECVRIFF